jgi:hypothetical protein
MALSAGLVADEAHDAGEVDLAPLAVDLAPLGSSGSMTPATPPSWYAELQDLAPAEPAPSEAPASSNGVAPVRAWVRHDDDILPSGASTKTKSKVKTPKEKASKAPKAEAPNQAKVKTRKGKHAKGAATAPDESVGFPGAAAAEMAGVPAGPESADAPSGKRSFSLRLRKG